MTISNRKSLPRLRVLTALMALAACGAAQAQHAKLDGALSDLVDQQQVRRTARLAVAADVMRADQDMMTDDQGRVLVDLYVQKGASLQAVQDALVAAGGQITGVNAAFEGGAISAYVPVASLTGLTGTGGLNVITMTVRPQRNVGKTTSQGTGVLRSNVANASGWTGAGITVGVLSDSYNGSPTTFTTIRAADDIASGDLRTPKFVVDAPPATNLTDEGRAMMQIVQDVAPQADQCFATAFTGAASFASNIRALRTNPACAADVIVDDVFYFDEPIFSDGQIAQAVNDVTTSTTLPGKLVSYFSSAGNQGSAGGGGAIDIPVATFSTTPTNLGNVNLNSVIACGGSPSSGGTASDVGGGFLDFGGGVFALPVTYTSASSRLLLQWDDLFYRGKVTTDLNFYLINSAGNCVFRFANNNLAVDNALETVSLNGGGSGNYRIMIGRTSTGTKQATRVRLVNLGGWGGAAFQVRSSPTTFGHSAAAGANSVAAYRYTYTAGPYTPAIEAFSSPGPVTIAFDAAGNRLAVPETRKKPDFAAPDGGNTTFFYPGSDYEGDGFPNFFGTSAAAPHAAAVAALMLQKAGGPGTLAPKVVKTLLQQTPAARVVPFSPAGTAATKGWSLYDGFGLIDAVTVLNKLP